MSRFTHGADARSIDLQLLPVFDGYPYLISRIGHTPLRHIALVPADWARERVVGLARTQASANRFDTVACFAFDDVVYVTPEDSTLRSDILPAGLPVIDRLRLAEEFPVTPELATRHALLEAFYERHRGDGFLVGDGLEGRRPATPEDRDRLDGIGPDGLPPGLRRCPKCRQAAGECLTWTGDVVRCRCACENDTLCARCGDPLAQWRLSAWYWDEFDRQPWYIAAYTGLGHYCPDDFTQGWVCPGHGPAATEVRVTRRRKVNTGPAPRVTGTSTSEHRLESARYPSLNAEASQRGLGRDRLVYSDRPMEKQLGGGKSRAASAKSGKKASGGSIKSSPAMSKMVRSTTKRVVTRYRSTIKKLERY